MEEAGAAAQDTADQEAEDGAAAPEALEVVAGGQVEEVVSAVGDQAGAGNTQASRLLNEALQSNNYRVTKEVQS